MPRPFEVSAEELRRDLEVFVDAAFADLTSAFLWLPTGDGFIEYAEFQEAYETLRRHTRAFGDLTTASVWRSLLQNSQVLGVVRAVLGLTPPEWAELARSERGSDITQNAARLIDRRCRVDPGYISRLKTRDLARRTASDVDEGARIKTLQRISDLVSVAVDLIVAGAPERTGGLLHRLDKYDTAHGLASLQYASTEDVPYAVLLFERYLGRPFAAHRDAVSELIGEVMEQSVEERLRRAGVTARRTKRAERIPGFGQAPDFCIPDEISPAIVIEAKVASDDGTARDKVTRILHLVHQRDRHVEEGRPRYEVVACIDGRGFRQRREDMRQLLLALDGKVFTTATLDRLVDETRLRVFAAVSTADDADAL